MRKLHNLWLLVLMGCLLFGTGLVESSSGGEVKWVYNYGSDLTASAIGHDGTVYTGESKGIFAMNPDGTLKWTFYIGSKVSNPAVDFDGTIYVTSENNKLYAINPDGTGKWSFDTGNPISSSPSIDNNGVVYMVSNEYLYAINKNGTLKWTFDLGDYTESSPVIDGNGIIYIGVWWTFFAINPDGTQKWATTVRTDYDATPAIGNDGGIYASSGKKFVTINPDGSIRWDERFGDLPAQKTGPVVGEDETIYFTKWWPGAAILWGVNPVDGGARYDRIRPAFDYSPFVIGSDGTIYSFVRQRPNPSVLTAMNPDGSGKWTLADSRIFYSNISPVLGKDGMLYVGKNGTLLAIQIDTKGVGKSSWPMWGQNPQRTNCIPLPAKVRLEMCNGNTAASINTIFPRYKLKNLGDKAIDLNKLSIRYYYTIDGEKPQNFYCDYAAVISPGHQTITSKITGKFAKVTPIKTGADNYLEVGFTGDSGTLVPDGIVEIHTRLAKNDWTNFNQLDDYSFSLSYNYLKWEKATVYYDNKLIWGLEP